MNELTTQLWSILLPEEWSYEQEDDTIIIIDDDEVSIIEITSIMLEEGENAAELISELAAAPSQPATMATLPAQYHDVVDDDMFWREWYCDGGKFVLVVSHGTDVSNRNIDDDIVDEILSTLSLLKE